MGNIIKRINEFEEGIDHKNVLLKHKEKERYLYLTFNVYKGERDSFVEDIHKIKTKDEDIYMAIYQETPTIYGHDLNYNDLTKLIIDYYEETTEELQWLSNVDEELWEKEEKYLDIHLKNIE